MLSVLPCMDLGLWQNEGQELCAGFQQPSWGVFEAHRGSKDIKMERAVLKMGAGCLLWTVRGEPEEGKKEKLGLQRAELVRPTELKGNQAGKMKVT